MQISRLPTLYVSGMALFMIQQFLMEARYMPTWKMEEKELTGY